MEETLDNTGFTALVFLIIHIKIADSIGAFSKKRGVFIHFSKDVGDGKLTNCRSGRCA